MDEDLYSGRGPTKAKHLVLKQYLQKLAYKWGWFGGTINYVDGFAGPWRSEAEDLRDTSPHIAIKELRQVREGLAKTPARSGLPNPQVRCLFVEKDVEAFQKLRTSVEHIGDMQIHVLNGEFEQHIAAALKFACEGFRPFGFFFIDPTGWTGFGMKTITPLLRHNPGEVLVNFMTNDIRRFIDDPTSVALSAYAELFGDIDYREEWKGLTGQEKEDAIVGAYCRRIKEAGGYKFVVSTMILHHTDNRTHFHLIYATRSLEGLRVFRDVEADVMSQQIGIRAKAQQVKRINKTSQQELFPSDDFGDTGYIQQLRSSYLARSKAQAENMLKSYRRIAFDEFEGFALSMPMTWKTDVKEWLNEWRSQELVAFEGLAPRARIPQRNSDHYVVWIQK